MVRFEFDEGTRPPPEEAMELREVLGILRRKWWLIMLCAVLGAGGAYALAQRQEPVYRAGAVIRVQDPSAQMGGQLAPMNQGWAWTDPVRSTLEVLTSQTVLGAIVDREGLRLRSLTSGFSLSLLERTVVGEAAVADTLQLLFRADEVEASSLLNGTRATAPYGETIQLGDISFALPLRPPVSSARLALRDRQAVIASIGARLSYNARDLTNIIDVEFTAPDPVQAQRVVNQAVQVFQERTTGDARRLSSRRRTFLEEQLAEVDLELRTTQQALSDFRIREQVFSSQDRALAQQTGLIEVDMRREELRADRQMYGSLLAGLLAATDAEERGQWLQSLAATPEISANPVVSTLFGHLVEYETERTALTSGPWGASPNNPDVAQLEQQMETTRRRLEVAIQSHMEAVDARLSALDALRDRTAGQIQGLPQAEAEEARLLQAVQSVQRTVERLREELYRAELTEAVEEGPISIVDLASLPTSSEQTGLPMLLTMGLILGILVGSGGAFLSEILNTSIRHKEDLEKALQVQILGVIPRLPNGKRGSGIPLPSLGRKNGKRRVQLVTVKARRSHQAEAFRTVRTNLLYGWQRADEKCLVITSPLPGEGKTTMAANLAVTYAQQGLKVCVVDCDLRKPSLDRVFGMDRKPGLTELILGEAPATPVIKKFDPVEGLYVIPSGSLSQSPTELLGGARMRSVLEALKQKFDMVILDTPPLSGGADGAILGAAADGVLMIVRAGKTDREAAKQAARQLHTVGARLLGAVINDPDNETPKYGGYYYHYEYYGEN